ncbi:MAG: NIPSNAP family protein [Hyphomicrobiaceae bacterium]|nr:MAG: NIPSNAP family protein [Hyphomicrobiaceae bacterium]
MIYELRTYTVMPGTEQDVAKAAGTIARDIRKDDYGKLEGYWITDIGPLNQVMHLWSYKDLNERQRLRGELGKLPRWNSEYLALIKPHLIRQEVRLLNCVAGPFAPASAGNLYELRNYRTKSGSAAEWARLLTGVLDARQKHSKMIGLWITEAPQPNEVCHIWVYPDLNTRTAARAAALNDPAWQAFIKQSRPLLEEMHSTIMRPAAHSPLR